jgi:hypothetical protein
MAGTRRIGSIFALVLFFAAVSARTARADIIGTFSWDDCGLFNPCFSVGNSSDFSAFSMDFSDAVVTLSTDQVPITESLNLGLPIGIEETARTVGDFSKFDISLAELSLSFSLPGTFTLETFDDAGVATTIKGLTSAGEMASIDFEPSMQPVPEPSTLMLLVAGLGVLGLETTRRRRAVRAARAPH